MIEKSRKVKMCQIDFLKPCPFCGKKIEGEQPHWDDLGTDDDFYVIRCPGCGVMMYNQDEEEVIALWNRRAKE